MADAIPPQPGPAATPAGLKSTVIVEAPMSQWAALKQAGWWSSLDWTISLAIIFMWLTAFYWKLFGDPDMMKFIFFMLATVVMLLIWLVVLVLRCALFVLKTHADIAMLPQESARIAVAYLSGKR